MTRDDIIKEVSKYFSVKELVCDHTYAKYGERSWQFLDTDFLHALLIIRRDILQVSMTCNSSAAHQRGLRCNMCDLVKSKKANYLSAHCFDKDTEILTTSGWKKHDSISDNDVLFSYNIKEDIIEKKPVAFITKEQYVGKMVKVESNHLDLMVTEAHDLIIRSVEKKYVRVGNKKYTESGLAYFNSLHRDTDKWHKEPAVNVIGKRRKFLCASNVAKVKECDLNFYKFCMATIADGYFEYKSGTPSIGFRFKKERKCKQIEELLQELGWYYTKNLDVRGVYTYYIRSTYAIKVQGVIGAKKNIPFDILDFGSESLRELVKYYALYDGCHSKRENDVHFTICTTNKNNAEMLQIMSVLSGMRCNCSEKKSTDIKHKTAYNLTINPHTQETKIKSDSTSMVDYDGIVWCATNENGTVIVRRNNKISIQGNCLGKAGDFTPKGMTAEQARTIIKSHQDLLPCNIRMEAGVTWLHFDVLPQYGIDQKVYEFRV